MPLGSPSIGNKYPGEKTITGGAFLHDMKSSQAERVDRECSRARGDGEPEMPSHTFNRREVPAVKLFTQAQKLNHGKLHTPWNSAGPHLLGKEREILTVMQEACVAVS